MILSGDEIQKNLGTGIEIDPFDEARLNANSYDLTLHDELMVYEEVVLDMQKPNRVRRVPISEDGMVLSPNQLYLGRTVERTTSHAFVPMIEGRSSVGRLGLFVNVTTGFGDVGFSGFWTLSMFAVQPVRIYPGIPICQIMFHELVGDVSMSKSQKYHQNTDIQPSLLHRELNPGAEEEEQAQLNLPFEFTNRVWRRDQGQKRVSP